MHWLIISSRQNSLKKLKCRLKSFGVNQFLNILFQEIASGFFDDRYVIEFGSTLGNSIFSNPNGKIVI